jgi:alpha-glucoside transport system substrate-binding protein
VDRRVTSYPNAVVEREAAMLTAARRFHFDASDRMPAAVNQAFWQAVVDYTRDPSQLRPILDRLEALRAGAT